MFSAESSVASRPSRYAVASRALTRRPRPRSGCYEEVGEEHGTKLAKAVGQRRSQVIIVVSHLPRSATVSRSHSGAVTHPAHAARLGLGRLGDLQAGAGLLPTLLPCPRPATDTGRRVWNIGPGDGRSWTSLDDLPTPTDQMVSGPGSTRCPPCPLRAVSRARSDDHTHTISVAEQGPSGHVHGVGTYISQSTQSRGRGTTPPTGS